MLEDEGENISIEELLQLENDRGPDNISMNDTTVSREIITKDLSTALSHFEEGLQILIENDLNEERSSIVAREVNKAIDCYKNLYRKKECHKTTQFGVIYGTYYIFKYRTRKHHNNH